MMDFYLPKYSCNYMADYRINIQLYVYQCNFKTELTTGWLGENKHLY